MNIKIEKEDLLDKIEKLEREAKILSAEIDLLRKKLKEVNFEENKYKRWRAEANKEYYYIENYDEVIQHVDTDSIVDNFLYSIGNYFQTQQEAQEYKENLITKQKLKDLALRLNKGVEIDWENIHQAKHSLYLESGEDLDIAPRNTMKTLGAIYCLDENFLDIAKEEIGEEALIKLIKSGV